MLRSLRSIKGSSGNLFSSSPMPGVFIVLAAVSFCIFLAVRNPHTPEGAVELPEYTPKPAASHLPDFSGDVMNQLLNAHRNMTFDDLKKHLHKPKGRLEQVRFDPLEAEYISKIRSKLQLTEDELGLYRKNGFVSVDLDQRYSFVSAYYQIYTADLPVFVTSDSILHAIHRSFDDLLAELELTTIAPALESILQATHQALPEEHPDELRNNYLDVDLYLTVARNLLANKKRHLQSKMANQPLKVSPRFHQDEAVKNILGLIQQCEIQVPGSNSTKIFGGERPVDFSQFIVRGHYTKKGTLSAYFRCMMWLSRADCGWFVQPVDPSTGIKINPERELINACLLAMSLHDSGQFETFEAMNRLLSHFAAQDDNLSVHTLDTLLMENAIREPDDLVDRDRVARIFKTIGDTGVATQLIRSQGICEDSSEKTRPIPSVFQLFGQKFAIDSFVLSNVVFDSIIFEDQRQQRYMPMGLDVMAALGNQTAVCLLEPELRKYRYSANLFAASRFVEARSNEFWSRDLYNIWLDAIRELDKDVTNLEHLPDVMKTDVWQLKQLQTQLGSWSELRHDMVLYAKQSYTVIPGCEYPAGYVEPYPELYGKFRRFMESMRTALLDFHKTQQYVAARSGQTFKGDARRDEKQIAYTTRAIPILQQLESIAQAELNGRELTGKQTLFLQQVVDQRGNVRFGSGRKPRYDGWYCDLFYNRDDAHKWDPTIIDVHTFPDPFDKPTVLEVGVGDANLGVIAINSGTKSTAYVGPLYSYYEFTHPANDRLDNDAWARMVGGTAVMRFPLPGKRRSTIRDLPDRPEWTRSFQGKPKRR